jgi:hypothetical protein
MVGGGGDAVFSAATTIEAILIAHLRHDELDAVLDSYDPENTLS